MHAPIDRRTELLGKIVEALLDSGAGDLSLRPLAERVGTSARLLIYHFESKEALVAAALAEVRHRIGASLAQRAADIHPTSLRTLLMMAWEWALEEPNQRYFRLLFEVDGLSMFDRITFSREVRAANSAVWIALIDKAALRLSEGGKTFSVHAVLIRGAFTGLLQEFLTTGDRENTTAALGALIDLLSGTAPAASQQGYRS
ncbi:MAG: TetR/AcrR family transcriptional regulator [Rhizomicrobium sp.]